MVQDLLASGAQAGAVSEEGSSVLHYLAISQAPEALDVVKLVFEAGPEKLDINAVDWDGYTALMRSSVLTVIIITTFHNYIPERPQWEIMELRSIC